MEAQRHGPSDGKNASLPRESLDSIELPKCFQNVGDARAFQIKHYMDIPIAAYADDPRAPAGDLVNLQGRADIIQNLSCVLPNLILSEIEPAPRSERTKGSEGATLPKNGPVRCPPLS